MAAGTFTVAGQRVRTSSTRRFVAFRVRRTFDGVRYGEPYKVSIFARGDSIARVWARCRREGFHSSEYFVVIDTTTGEQV